MTKKYHINPDTHEVGICTAKISCKFGENMPHYENVVEAHQEAERQLEEEFDTFYVQRPLNVGMHATHCCEDHGCKYNADNCPVESGKVNAKYPCEYCYMDKEIEEEMPKPEEFQRTFEAGESFSSQVDIGEQFSYDGEVYEVEDIFYNRPLLQYEIQTDKGEVTISDDNWYWNANRIKLFGKDEVMKDPEEFQKDFVAGTSFGEQVNIGDQFAYNGEVYKVKDFEYNSALLQYEIQTNKGEVTISDDNWYWNASRIKLLGGKRSVDDFTKSTTPGTDGGNFVKELRNSGEFYYEGKSYKLERITYDDEALEYSVTTDKGVVYIPDDDWYYDSKVKILPNDF